MLTKAVHQCQCPDCQGIEKPNTFALHQQINLFVSRLDEQQRRWYAALEAKRLGHGGTKRLSQITGLHVNTIRRGRRELGDCLEQRPVGRIRLKGGGRKAIEKKNLRLLSNLNN